MSDGGAQVVVETVSGLAKFKVGRVVLWLMAAYLVLVTATSHARDASLWFFAAFALALTALIAGFIAERRKHAERASLRNALAFIGLTLVTLAGGVFLIFRRKNDVTAAPPSETEVNALVDE
ncbi:MAG: hypothetical protein ACO1OB_01095 [Archangium sp.]